MLNNVKNIAFYQIDTNCCFESLAKKKKWQILELYFFNMETFN